MTTTAPRDASSIGTTFRLDSPCGEWYVTFTAIAADRVEMFSSEMGEPYWYLLAEGRERFREFVANGWTLSR
jgi:hypothetical protein